MYFKRIIKFVCLIFLFSPSLCYAQKEANIWYFGVNAGLDFNYSPPKVLLDGQIVTAEGTSVISDKNGNLLFYTDGIKVWNKQHQVMPNGTGLRGGYSSTQSAMIVPFPGDNNRYYIFTTGAESQNPGDLDDRGFYYNVVDIRLANGTGEVTIKNQPLLPKATEKLTAVKHSNEKDTWVLVHEADSDAFHAYLVTDSGILPPVISRVGKQTKGPVYPGYLKASLQGNRLTAAFSLSNTLLDLFIYDFDKTTGVITNPVNLTQEYCSYYGLEFSPDGTKLYASEVKFKDQVVSRRVAQFDLAAGSKEQIFDSHVVIYSDDRNDRGALQLAPDGKIYFARRGDDFVDVINRPNLKGSQSGYSIRSLI